jgi:peroxiredoxin Q/BCP
MSRKTLVALLTLPSLLVSFLTGAANAEFEELIVGSPAPTFKLKDQHNRLHELKQYTGKWLVLYFYPKNNTPGCTKEACNFSDDIAKLKKLNAAVLGVSIDNLESHKEFSDKYNLQFPLLADTEAITTQDYGSLLSILWLRYAKRHSFIIAPDGVIAKIYRDVDAETHSQEIIKDLTLLISNR